MAPATTGAGLPLPFRQPGNFMSPTPTRHTLDHEPGQLLDDLERRQDEVLVELDALDAKLKEVLKGLGSSFEDEMEV